MNLKSIARAIDPIDPKFFNQVAQYAHFFAGATVAQYAHFFAGATVFFIIGRFSHTWMFYLLPVGVGLAALKEFIIDPRTENEATRGSDLEDFCFYLLGMAVALAVVML
jgi:hypothetical protein